MIDYMQYHPNINPNMRAILINWLVDVHRKFKLNQETLYLTIHLLDKFLSTSTTSTDIDITQDNFQLIGTACFVIACKYEEIYPPYFCELVNFAYNSFSEQDIVDMETTILKCLKYRITVPTANAFLSRYLKASAHQDNKNHDSVNHLANYMLETSLLDYRMLKYKPSEQAAAAIMIARKLYNLDGWNSILSKYTHYTKEEILPIAHDMDKVVQAISTTNLVAVKHKYGKH